MFGEVVVDRRLPREEARWDEDEEEVEMKGRRREEEVGREEETVVRLVLRGECFYFHTFRCRSRGRHTRRRGGSEEGEI